MLNRMISAIPKESRNGFCSHYATQGGYYKCDIPDKYLWSSGIDVDEQVKCKILTSLTHLGREYINS